MSAEAKTAGQRLAALWRRLTEPLAASADSETRRQARLLAKLTLLVVPLALALTVFNYAINPAPRPGIAQLIAALLLVVGALVYALVRSRLYLAGAAVVILPTLGLLLTYALIGQISQYILYYLLIPLALLALVFSARWALALLAAVVAAAVLITLALGIPVHTVIVDPLSFLVILTGLLLVVRAFLDERERDRRAQLAASEERYRLLTEALRDAAASVARTLDLDEVLDRILASVGRVVPYDAASIMLIEDGVAAVVRYQGFQYADREAFLSTHRFPVLSTPSLREVYDRGQVVLIDDTAAYPGWVSLPMTDWIRSWLGAPIRVGGAVIGFLNVDSGQPGHFTPQHAERLQAFADQCSAAIHNARLYQTVREQAADLERRVAARTAELEQERRELIAILDSMGEGMCYTEGGRIHYANRALLEMTGFAAAELIDMPLGALIVDTDRAGAADLETAQRGSRVWRDELLMRTRSETLLEVGITIAPLNGAGAAPGAAVLVRDISLEKALQRQKNRFISTASHELRTPLTNLTTRLYLIQRDPARLDEHLAVIGEVVNRMRRLSEDLLDLARLEHGAVSLARQPTVLQELAAAVARVQQAEAELKGVALVLRLPNAPVVANVDPDRIVQVITNLVVNAVNYTSAGGQVTLEVALLDDAQAVIRVSDTGVGIAPEHLGQVFEPFFRATGEGSRGSGLGLSIARELVQLHGGEISVASELGRGSAFTVRLPALAAG